VLLAEKGLDVKDIPNYILSALAFLMSLAAFVFSVSIQRKERKRNIRQTLSTALNDIARVNVEVSKLKNNEEENQGTLATRKNYNTQRGTLVADADFLMHEKMNIVTALDCALMASTFYDLGNFEKAAYYWRQCLGRCRNPEDHFVYTRDYASFLFNCNRIEEARKQFSQAFKFNLEENDDNRRLISDSYLLWAKFEQSFSYEKEFEKLMKCADEECEKIEHSGKYDEMKKLLKEAMKQNGSRKIKSEDHIKKNGKQ
jgi:tetratricopeptide (TPR) repeat protein